MKSLRSVEMLVVNWVVPTRVVVVSWLAGCLVGCPVALNLSVVVIVLVAGAMRGWGRGEGETRYQGVAGRYRGREQEGEEGEER